MSEMNQPLLQVLLSLLFFSATIFIFSHLQHRQQKPKSTGPHITNQRWVHKWQWEAAEFRHWQTQSGGVWWSSIHKQIYPNIPNLERKYMNVLRLKEALSSAAMPSQSSVSFALTPSPPVQSSSCCFSCPQLIWSSLSDCSEKSKLVRWFASESPSNSLIRFIQNTCKIIIEIGGKIKQHKPFLFFSFLFFWVGLHSWKREITKIMHLWKQTRGS